MAFELTLKGNKKLVYPTKTSINLAVPDKSDENLLRNALMIIAVVVLVALFAKFAVIDVIGAASAKQSEVAAAQSQLAALTKANSDFDELQEQYSNYAVTNMSEEERALADRSQVLELLQGTVANIAQLQSVNVSGNTVMLQFSNTSLQDVSRVVASLEESDLVSNVSMSTAKTDRNDEVVSTVTVTLTESNAVSPMGSSSASASAASTGSSASTSSTSSSGTGA